MNYQRHKGVRWLTLGILVILSAPSALGQGFLEMPDTTEVPEYERESMLLDLDIPSVRERDPDPEAGPRLNVKEFRLQGLVEYPQLGITRDGLIKRVEEIRFDLMKEGDLTDSGYTLDELGEVSDLMAEIEKETKGQHVGSLEVQKLVFLIREQRRRRGVTLGMIETVADTITQYYRERGFILAKAYIPQQKVRDGVVTLTLLLGEMGEVIVENKKRVSGKIIQRAFKKDLRMPVTSWKTEEALYLVNDIPGLTAQGFFSPGSQVGDTQLNVNILAEEWYSANLRVDNHGSRNTGEKRVYGDFYLHNPLGIGDEWYFSLLNSFDPDDTTYGAVRYNSFLWNPRVRGSIGYSNNDFISRDITQGNSSTFFTGESQVSDISLKYIFRRSRVKNLSIELAATDISTELNTFTSTGGSVTNLEDDVLNFSLAFNFDILNERRRQLYLGNISLNHTNNAPITGSDAGLLTGSETENAIFLNYDYSMLSFWTIPYIKAETRLLFKSAGQYAGKGMTSVNQFSLTGPTRNRAYQVNAAQFDDGIYLGVDWIFTLPKFGGASLFGESVNRVFQPFIFADAGYGVLHPRVDGDQTIKGTLSNVGIGIKFNHSSISGSVSFAKDVTDDIDLLEETPTNSMYFDMQYAF